MSADFYIYTDRSEEFDRTDFLSWCKALGYEVELTSDLETCHKGLFIIGDGSGVTHSLSHASASGVHVARYLAEIM